MRAAKLKPFTAKKLSAKPATLRGAKIGSLKVGSPKAMPSRVIVKRAPNGMFYSVRVLDFPATKALVPESAKLVLKMASTPVSDKQLDHARSLAQKAKSAHASSVTAKFKKPSFA